MPAVKKFAPKPADPDATRVSARDLVGSLVVIHVREVKHDIKTKFQPEGVDAISIDIASVETGNVAMDQLWFNGALVDALSDYVGDYVPCRIAWATSASGRAYLVVEEVSDSELEAATQFMSGHPDAFTADTEPEAVKSEAKPAAKPRW